MEEQVCPQCKRVFMAYRSQRRVYCGHACRVAAGVSVKKKRGWFKPCEACGAEFWVIPARADSARFCSVECKDRAVLLAEHICIQCGSLFKAWPSEARKYCSQECSAAHKTFRRRSPCETCGKMLDPKRNQNRFCSLECAHAAARTGQEYPCGTCGIPVYRRPNEVKNTQEVFCSRDCANESQRLQGPGKTFKMASGYVYRYYPKHPDASSSGLVAEHRWVAEQTIGRRIRKDEHVHHKNGIKDDNRPANLEVIKAGDHTRLTVRAAAKKRRSEADELEQYRRRFGPLE